MSRFLSILSMVLASSSVSARSGPQLRRLNSNHRDNVVTVSVSAPKVLTIPSEPKLVENRGQKVFDTNHLNSKHVAQAQGSELLNLSAGNATPVRGFHEYGYNYNQAFKDHVDLKHEDLGDRYRNPNPKSRLPEWRKMLARSALFRNDVMLQNDLQLTSSSPAWAIHYHTNRINAINSRVGRKRV